MQKGREKFLGIRKVIDGWVRTHLVLLQSEDNEPGKAFLRGEKLRESNFAGPQGISKVAWWPQLPFFPVRTAIRKKDGPGFFPAFPPLDQLLLVR